LPPTFPLRGRDRARGEDQVSMSRVDELPSLSLIGRQRSDAASPKTPSAGAAMAGPSLLRRPALHQLHLGRTQSEPCGGADITARFNRSA
jgi:hypothetical protein